MPQKTMRKKITLLVVCFCSKHIVQSMQITDIKMVTSSKSCQETADFAVCV